MPGSVLAGRALGIALACVCLACSGRNAPETPDLRSHRVLRPGVAFEMLRDNPELVVLDVRPFSEYASTTGHLQRALSLPAERLESSWTPMGLGREKTVMIYGDDGGSHQEAAMRFLLDNGQRYVVQIEGGLEAWRKGGFPVIVEDAPLSPVRID